MKIVILLATCYLLLATFLLGCAVRTYTITKERVDLSLEGNRGYLKGNPPPIEREPKKTRTINVLEIEIGKPVRIE